MAYQLYEWFRETRALRVIIGLVVLAVHQETSTVLTAPVHYENLPAGLKTAEGSTRTVALTLSGRRRYLDALRSQLVRVHVNPNNSGAGKQLIKISARNVDLPRGVKFDSAVPAKIKVVLKSASAVQPPSGRMPKPD